MAVDGTVCKAFKSTLWIGFKGESLPCCRYKNGEDNPCVVCDVEESVGIRSLRQKLQHLDPSLGLQYLDLNLSNACNLTCISCNSKYSSSWAKILGKSIKEKGSSQFQVLSDLFDGDKLSAIKRIKLAGGEPFLINAYWKFLSQLGQSRHADIPVTLFTNGTCSLSSEKLDILKKINNLELVVSIDGLDLLNNYLRPPSIFQAIDIFLNKARHYLPLVVVHSVQSMLNENKMFELSDYLQKLNIDQRITILSSPEVLSTFTYVEAHSDQWKKLLNKIKTYDALSGLKFYDINPERFSYIERQSQR